jgi:hypothetical protein
MAVAPDLTNGANGGMLSRFIMGGLLLDPADWSD